MVFLEILQHSQENTCARVSFLIKIVIKIINFYENRETQAQVFYCEFCEISKNTFFTVHLWATVSDNSATTVCLSLITFDLLNFIVVYK